MKRLSEEAKLSIIKKALVRNGQTISEVAEDHNVTYSALSRWLRNYKSVTLSENCGMTPEAENSLAERFKHLQATVDQDDVTVGAYCRKHGLYTHQLTQWKSDFMTQKSLKIANSTQLNSNHCVMKTSC
jgi:transposase-like protein